MTSAPKKHSTLLHNIQDLADGANRVQITLTEQIIVAILTCAGTLAVGWFGLRGVIRKSQQEEMATNTTARVELERLLMARIDQLQQHITALEARIAAKDARIVELERRVDELEHEKDEWQTERAQLKAELARLCAQKRTE